MSAASIIVFLPTDIFTVEPRTAEPPKAVSHGREFYSTGRLEYAKKNEAICCVLLPQTAIVGRDEWWKDMLDDKKDLVLELEDGNDMASIKALRTIKDFYRQHGLQWDDSWLYWNTAVHALSASIHPELAKTKKIFLARELDLKIPLDSQSP